MKISKDILLFAGIITIGSTCIIHFVDSQNKTKIEKVLTIKNNQSYNVVETAKQRYLATHPEVLGTPVICKDILPFIAINGKTATEESLAYQRPLGIYTETFTPEEIPTFNYGYTVDTDLLMIQMLLLAQ
jgi:hypothetical protein